MKTTNPWLKQLVVASATALAFAATSAQAAVDMFLKIDGIAGESVDKDHRGEIEIASFSWEIAPKSGDLVGRTARVCAHDLSFVKSIDSTSPVLISNAIVGTIVPKAALTFRKAGEGQKDFMTIELVNVLISSVNHAASSSSTQLAEQFTLNFTGGTVTFKPQKPDGSLGTPVVANISRTC
jgi:type VI secretion system secreted protein Hcp